MTTHDAIRDLLAAVALDAAHPDETREVERHVESCPECAGELGALRAAVGAIAHSVPQEDAPPSLRKRVLEQIGEDAATLPVVASPSRRAKWRFGWPALSTAFAAAAIGLFAWNVSLRTDADQTLRQVAIAATTQAPDVSGSATSLTEGTTIIRVRGLPPLKTGQRYELWTIRNGQPRSEGFAAVTPDGEAVVATAGLQGAQALAITRESPTNTVAPTEVPLITVPVDSQGLAGA